MKLEQLKQAEDMRVEKEELSKQRAEENLLKIKQVTQTAIKDFEGFFKENGFVVRSSTGRVTATYKGLTAEMRYEEPYKYLGSILSFDLSLPDNIEHRVSLKSDWTLHLNTDKGSKTFNSMRELLGYLLD